MNRRKFLKGGIAAATMTPCMASFAGLLSSLNSSVAKADTPSEYKALVCMFLYGGMDNHDTVIPYDAPNYERWAKVRRPLLNSKTKRAREDLNRLSGTEGQQQYALPQNYPVFTRYTSKDTPR